MIAHPDSGTPWVGLSRPKTGALRLNPVRRTAPALPPIVPQTAVGFDFALDGAPLSGATVTFDYHLDGGPLAT